MRRFRRVGYKTILRRARKGKSLPLLRFGALSRYRKRSVYSRIGRVPTHHFKRRGVSNQIALTANALGGGGYGFGSAGLSVSLNSGGGANFNVVNPTDFTNLYDRYRLNKVVFEFKWSLTYSADLSNSAMVPDNKLLNPPIMYIFNDCDDVVAPTYTEILERANVKKFCLNPNRIYRSSMIPSILVDGQMPKWKQWIDMADSNKIHLGQKIGLVYNRDTDYGVLSITPLFYFSCKDTK